MRFYDIINGLTRTYNYLATKIGSAVEGSKAAASYMAETCAGRYTGSITKAVRNKALGIYSKASEKIANMLAPEGMLKKNVRKLLGKKEAEARPKIV
jgi:hypothetical protein